MTTIILWFVGNGDYVVLQNDPASFRDANGNDPYIAIG